MTKSRTKSEGHQNSNTKVSQRRKGCRCVRCRELQRVYARHYRLQNLEKIRAWERVDSRRKIVSGQAKKYGRTYREKHREKTRESSRQWRLANPETAKAVAMRFRQTPRCCENLKKWIKANPEKIRHYQRRWRQKESSRERVRARVNLNYDPLKAAKYREKYKDKRAAYYQSERGKRTRQNGWLAYHARKHQAQGVCTIAQLGARWAFYGNKCYLCGDVATTTDHVIPLSKNGSHWPSNLRPACRTCNVRKNAIPLAEYLRRRKHRVLP